MTFFLGLLGVLGWLWGIVAFLGAKSAIHEILGSLGFGLGTLVFAIAVLIDRVQDGNNLLKKLVDERTNRQA